MPNSTGGSSIIIISVISLIVISRQDMYDVRTCMHDLLRLQISNFTIFNAIIILSDSFLKPRVPACKDREDKSENEY